MESATSSPSTSPTSTQSGGKAAHYRQEEPWRVPCPSVSPIPRHPTSPLVGSSDIANQACSPSHLAGEFDGLAIRLSQTDAGLGLFGNCGSSSRSFCLPGRCSYRFSKPN